MQDYVLQIFNSHNSHVSRMFISSGNSKGWFSKVHVLNACNLFILIYQNILQLPMSEKLKENILYLDFLR